MHSLVPSHCVPLTRGGAEMEGLSEKHRSLWNEGVGSGFGIAVLLCLRCSDKMGLWVGKVFLKKFPTKQPWSLGKWAMPSKQGAAAFPHPGPPGSGCFLSSLPRILFCQCSAHSCPIHGKECRERSLGLLINNPAPLLLMGYWPFEWEWPGFSPCSFKEVLKNTLLFNTVWESANSIVIHPEYRACLLKAWDLAKISYGLGF